VTFEGDGRLAVIELEIEEGPRTLTGAIRFEGNEALSDQSLLERLNLRQGDPYNERLVEEDVYRLLSAYSERGYLYARVEAEKTPGEGTMDVTYRVSEDRPVRTGKIIVRGNGWSKDTLPSPFIQTNLRWEVRENSRPSYEDCVSTAWQ